jgi:hypothetical protein
MTARSIHGCALLHHIGSNLCCNLCLVKRALSSSCTPKSCPTAYLIPRVPFSVAHSDSSLTAVGRYCPAAKFWWYLKWPTMVQARTLRHIHMRQNPLLISINSLEYAAQLITMLDCHLHSIKTKTTH